MNPPTQIDHKNLTLTHIAYLLYALGVLIWFLPVAAIIINYLKVDDVRGTWLESHFEWQMQTFWKALLWWLIGLALCLIAIGVVVILVVFIWYLYRIIKGWIALSDGMPMVINRKLTKK